MVKSAQALAAVFSPAQLVSSPFSTLSSNPVVTLYVLRVSRSSRVPLLSGSGDIVPVNLPAMSYR